MPVDCCALIGELGQPTRKVRRMQLDLSCEERHEHDRRAEPHVIPAVRHESRHWQAGPLRFSQRRGLVVSQIGLVGEPFPVVEHA